MAYDSLTFIAKQVNSRVAIQRAGEGETDLNEFNIYFRTNVG